MLGVAGSRWRAHEVISALLHSRCEEGSTRKAGADRVQRLLRFAGRSIALAADSDEFLQKAALRRFVAVDKCPKAVSVEVTDRGSSALAANFTRFNEVRYHLSSGSPEDFQDMLF